MSRLTEWGTTPEERRQSYPCDRYVDSPSGVLHRAISICAPPSLVFSWLCQLRVAPYSYDWLDHWGRKSPRRRDPANEQLAVGQIVMSIFRLVEYEPGRHLTMVIDRTRIFGRLALTYQVNPSENGTTRLVVKLTFRQRRYSLMRLILPVGDFIMMKKQLRTLQRLAETEARTRMFSLLPQILRR